MIDRDLMAARNLALAILVMAALLAGCAGQRTGPEAIESFDERTAATLTRVPEPLVFYVEEPTLAANARDYLHLAPVTINRGGAVSRWLWVATWSSIDRGAGRGTESPAALSGLQLVVDGEPMELDMASAQAAVDGLRDSPYGLPVATAVQWYVPVTATQLERMARARTVTLASEHGASGGRSWQRWSPDPATLRAFAPPAGPLDRPAAPVAMRTPTAIGATD